MVTWEPFTSVPATTPDDVLRRVADGEYDESLAAWGDALAAWRAGPDGTVGTDDDRRLYRRPMHEANRDWYLWAPASGGCAPETYVAAWRRTAWSRTPAWPTTT